MTEFVRKPASKLSIAKRKSVFEVGINDAWYVTQPTVNGKRVVCPFYRKWVDMLSRCYSAKYLEKRPTYRGCSVCDSWLTFSNFLGWAECQNWARMELDKDLLSPGNKVYSPDTCVFIPQELNTLMTDRRATRGEFKIGVHWYVRAKKFQSMCKLNGKKQHLGCFDTEAEAHRTYCLFKAQIICDAAETYAHLHPGLKNGLLQHADLLLDSISA